MSQNEWMAVDAYFDDLFVPSDAVLEAALNDTAAAGMPAISVSPQQGKLLNVLVRSHRAGTILEIGTLGGYSTICLARGLPDGGRLLTLEIDPKHADVARKNIARAGLDSKVEVRVGAAIDALPQLVDDERAPFDLVFIDADKVSTPHYLEWALRLTHPGSVIIIDNVVRNGGVAVPGSTDPNVQGVQKGLEMLSKEPRVIASAIQTVGSKGYDGFAIAVVTQ